jgi:hypothetical protein
MKYKNYLLILFNSITEMFSWLCLRISGLTETVLKLYEISGSHGDEDVDVDLLWK